MVTHSRLAAGLGLALAAAGGLAAMAAPREPAAAGETADIVETRRAMAEARVQSQDAKNRAEHLEGEAARATAAADRTSQDAAAIAARIQQAEAEAAENEAQIHLAATQIGQLRDRLARYQQPLIRLTAALELLARRPLVLALFRPGAVVNTVHMRALIASMIPEVQRRTAVLRGEIAQGRALQGQLRRAEAGLRNEEALLDRRRQALAAVELQQRLDARVVNGSADREAERALALAEQARDLGSLVQNLGLEDDLRAELVALPGPVLRPVLRPDPSAMGPSAEGAAPAAMPAPTPFAGYALPLTGRLVAGFGDIWQGARSRGLIIATAPGAQVVAPAAGRVAFAGPYRGYGQIVIITHDAGWTSLVTGLAEVTVRVGDSLVAGAPLGVAGPGRPALGFELRHNGVPVNPLDHLGG
ncbi:MAG: peptidoglycan DD-metalloendopeptidase family protein [Sphingomonadales bacterium]|nr:peptidoglycan DD-metalloendopeptidase family protein [Sphingomonadales bacterium]